MDEYGGELGLAHLRSMYERAKSSNFSEGKLGRWLGWVQCAVVAANLGVTLDEMKALNLRHAERKTSTHCLICERENCYHMGCGLT